MGERSTRACLEGTGTGEYRCTGAHCTTRQVNSMAPRPNWKGYLKVSLVSCSVAVYSATSTSHHIRYHVITREPANRVKNQVVDAETGDPVEPEDRVKGYEASKGQYVL